MGQSGRDVQGCSWMFMVVKVVMGVMDAINVHGCHSYSYLPIYFVIYRTVEM